MKISKIFITSLVVIFLLYISSCIKDDKNDYIKPIITTYNNTEVVLEDIPLFRSGDKDIILFRSSLSTDNFLLTPTEPRTHKVFNKNKVAYIDFSPGTLNTIGIGSDYYSHYNIKVMFNDSTDLSFYAYSKDSIDYFRYYPIGENILRSSHKAKFVTWVQNPIGSTYTINEFRDNKINAIRWSVYYDSTFIYTDIKYPTNKNSNWFQPQHLN